MENYVLFKKSIANVVDEFKKIDVPVRIVSHLDSDGLSSAAILIKAFIRENMKFSLSIVRQLTKEILEQLSREDYEYYLFADLGSSVIDNVGEILNNKIVFVLDHHEISNGEYKNIHHVNPGQFGIDGSKEISGAGVVYFFAKTLNENNKDMAHIALIGAIGDVQENRGFQGLNLEILDDAINADKLEVKTGLRMFGMQTKSLHKILAYSTDIYIPGVSGSESKALSFLQEIGIEPKNGKTWKKLIHLDEDDMKKLVTGVILKRLGSEKSPEDVLGPVYLLKDEEEESPMKDVKEFSTLLNSCGRLNKPSIGISACLSIKNAQEEAISVLTDYKRQLINAMDWFYSNKASLIEGNRFVIINAEDNINETIIGTLASIVAKTNIYVEGTVIVAMANTIDGKTKISFRKVGNDDVNLLELTKKIVDEIGGEAGGHSFNAAGAIIDQENNEKFIEIAKDILSSYLVGGMI